MIRRLSMLIPAVAACLLLLPACGKKPAAPTPGPGDPTPGGPSAVATEYLAFAHVNAKDVIGGELFAEIKKAFGGPDGAKMWADVEKQAVAAIGVKPGDLSSLTAFVTEFDGQGPPKFIAILTADKAFDKAGLLKSMEVRNTKPDGRGFYTGGPGLIHFADEKTVVALSPDLADKYLGGYAKDRAGWPTNADLAKAAEGHTLYAQVQLDKLPAAMRSSPDLQQIAPLGEAKAATVTLDLKGKTLALNVRGSFADADTAGKAKEKLIQFAQIAALGLEAATGKESELGAVAPAVKEAKRAIKDIKIEASGSDVTVATSYTADFDFGAMIAEATGKVRAAAARMTSSNNLKQLGLALHNYESTYGFLPVHAVGKNGAALTGPGDKPLLSWRVAILPFIEQGNLYQEFKLDEPWDSEHNKKLIDKMPKTFVVPGSKTAKAGHTYYQMAVGTGALQPGKLTLVGITDGSSNTIGVVEAAEAVEWTKPADVPVARDAKDLKKKFGGHFTGGFNVMLWDGSVRFLPNALPEASLRGMLTPNGGEVIRD